MEQRAAIKFCVKFNKTATETFELLKMRTAKNVYREEVCLNEIKGSKSLEDDERKGRPSTFRIKESTEVIQKCLAEDRTMSGRMLE
jgi:hypothetical protein